MTGTMYGKTSWFVDTDPIVVILEYGDAGSFFSFFGGAWFFVGGA